MPEAVSALEAMASALVATLAVECALAYVAFGVRDPYDLGTVALAQTLTNPVVSLVSIATGFGYRLPPTDVAWLCVGAAEVAAFVCEALLYRAERTTARPFLLSGVLNAASLAMGALVSLMCA